jgi:polyisoprenoid-binding protein YceI
MKAIHSFAMATAIIFLSVDASIPTDPTSSNARRGPHVSSPSRTEIDISKSVIAWRGTKLLGTGEHQGTLKFLRGHIESDAGLIVGGTLLADMNSIRVTDIPPDDEEPIRNLTNHLNADFETSTYPVASFNISSTKGLRICGDLTIKTKMKPVCLDLQKIDDHFSTTLTIKRSGFGIGEKGSWLEKRLVDDEIYLTINIWLKR